MQFKKVYFPLIFSFLCFSFVTKAQSSNGAFGGPEVKFTTLKGKSAFLIGGRAGWIIDKHIVLGGGFYSLVSNVKTGIVDAQGNPYDLGFNYGGLELEYIALTDETFNFSADMLFAGGGISFSPESSNSSDTYYESQDLLVWEPSLNFEIKTTPWMHMDLGASYRFVSQFDKSYTISKGDLESFNFLIVLKFGEY